LQHFFSGQPQKLELDVMLLNDYKNGGAQTMIIDGALAREVTQIRSQALQNR